MREFRCLNPGSGSQRRAARDTGTYIRLSSCELPECDVAEKLGWVYRVSWPNATALYKAETTTGRPRPMTLTKGLYYPGSAVDIMDSLEMSCRIGRNAADLLVLSNFLV
jgi:hypothetical protein